MTKNSKFVNIIYILWMMKYDDDYDRFEWKHVLNMLILFSIGLLAAVIAVVGFIASPLLIIIFLLILWLVKRLDK